MHSRLTRLGGIKGGGRCSRPFCILEFKLQTSKMATVPAFEGLLGSSAPAGCDHQRSPPCLPAFAVQSFTHGTCAVPRAF